MTQELIYTSAPRGLRSGVKGFCTVASTAGMAVTLADRLESLSGYRHLFPPHDERAPQNPVNYSHLKIVVGGQSFDVLSRICDAGIDYSQRSNKLAHHVAMAPNECPPCGPARLLAEPGFMEKSWQGEPRILSAGRKPPSLTESPRICTAWQKATGDAGWAGVLAATANERDPKPAHLIIPVGLDALPLVAESLALVAPERRWDVTFSTFFTRLPPGVDCQWRFVIDGQPEAETARRSPHWLVFDLCKPMPSAPDSPLVTAALTGKLPHIEPARQQRATMVLPDLPDPAELSPAHASSPSVEAVASTADHPSDSSSIHARRHSEARAARTSTPSAKSRRGVPKAVLYATAALCVTLVLASVAFVAYLVGSRSHHEITFTPAPEFEPSMPSPTTSTTTDVAEPKTPDSPEVPESRETSGVASASKPEGSTGTTSETPPPSTIAEHTPTVVSPPPVSTKPEPQKFEFVGLGQGRTTKATLRLDGSSDPLELVRWENDHGATVKIETQGDNAANALEISNVGDEWTLKTNVGITPVTIARIERRDSLLTLVFDTTRAEDQARLLGHVLRINVGDEECLVTFDFHRNESKIDFGIQDCQKKTPKKFEPGWPYLPNGYHLKQNVESLTAELSFDRGEAMTRSGRLKGFSVELSFTPTEKPQGSNVASIAIKPEAKILLLPQKSGSGFQPLSKASVENALNQTKSALTKLKKDQNSANQPNSAGKPPMDSIKTEVALKLRIEEESKAQSKLTDLMEWLDTMAGQPIVRVVGQIHKDRL